MAAFARTSQKFSFMPTADEVLLHTYLPYRVRIVLGFETIHTSYLELELEWLANSFHKEFGYTFPLMKNLNCSAKKQCLFTPRHYSSRSSVNKVKQNQGKESKCSVTRTERVWGLFSLSSNRRSFMTQVKD